MCEYIYIYIYIHTYLLNYLYTSLRSYNLRSKTIVNYLQLPQLSFLAVTTTMNRIAIITTMNRIAILFIIVLFYISGGVTCLTLLV